MNKFIAGAVVTTGLLLSAEAIAESYTKSTTHMHDLTHSKNKSIAYSFDTEFSRAGDGSQKFYLITGNCGRDKHGSDCTRDAERVERVALRDHNPGKTYWYSYSVMYPEVNEVSTYHQKVPTVLGQVKAYGVDKPIWIMKHRDGKIEMDVHFAGDDPAGKNGGDGEWCTMGRESLMIGKWMDVLIKADYSSKQKDGHSYFQVWINGEEVCDITDTIVNKHTWSKRFANKKKKLSFRYGIYNFKLSKFNGTVPNRVVYFDEVKSGKTKESVLINTNNPVD